MSSFVASSSCEEASLCEEAPTFKEASSFKKASSCEDFANCEAPASDNYYIWQLSLPLVPHLGSYGSAGVPAVPATISMSGRGVLLEQPP